MKETITTAEITVAMYLFNLKHFFSTTIYTNFISRPRLYGTSLVLSFT